MDFAAQLHRDIGGRAGLRPVIERFYEKVFADPWLGQMFEGVEQAKQVQRLEDFLCHGVPGEPRYTGDFPAHAHAHLFIPQAMIKRRTQLLAEAIRELGHPEEIVRIWLRTDALWHSAVRKESVEDCRGREGRVVEVSE